MTEKSKEPCWYVVHTYSGYENKVKDTLEKSVENNGMQDLIFDVRVPVEDVIEIKNGKRVKTQRKVYPGYVLVSDAEVEMMLNTEAKSVEFGVAIGEEVRILSGPLENFTGIVEDVDTIRDKLTVKVQMFLGREMPVEVDLDQVEKVSK